MSVMLKAFPAGTETYLVTGDEQLVYVLVPSRRFRYPPAAEWPEKSREWVERWKPVSVASEDELVIDGSLTDNQNLFAEFSTIRRQEGSTVRHVRLKAGNFDWRLYTYENDDGLSTYSLSDDDSPPGWVTNLWLPAPITDDLLLAVTPPVGATDSGGP